MFITTLFFWLMKRERQASQNFKISIKNHPFLCLRLILKVQKDLTFILWVDTASLLHSHIIKSVQAISFLQHINEYLTFFF